MSRLWLLRGALDAPGWKLLQADQKAETVDIVHLDRQQAVPRTNRWPDKA
jgi:hypothetical protein